MEKVIVNSFLNEEDKMFFSLFEEIGKKEILKERERADRDSSFPVSFIQKLKELELLNMFIREEYGGANAHLLTKSLFFYTISNFCAGISSSFLFLCLFAEIIQKYYNGEDKEELLKKFIYAREIGTISFNLLTKEFLNYKNNSFSGKAFLPLFKTCNFFLIPFQNSQGIYIGILKKNSLKAKPISLMGLRATEPFVQDFHQEKINTVFSVNFKEIEDLFLIYLSAILLGICAGAIKDTSVYIKERKVFGKRIFDLEGIKRNLNDLQAEFNAAVTYLFYHLKNEIKRENFPREVFHLSCKISQKITQETLRMYGGYGYIKEYPAEKRMRDAKVLESLGGFGVKREEKIYNK